MGLPKPDLLTSNPSTTPFQLPTYFLIESSVQYLYFGSEKNWSLKFIKLVPVINLFRQFPGCVWYTVDDINCKFSLTDTATKKKIKTFTRK